MCPGFGRPQGGSCPSSEGGWLLFVRKLACLNAPPARGRPMYTSKGRALNTLLRVR